MASSRSHRSPGADVGQELVGHLVQRQLGDLEPVLGDQGEQEVERTLELVEPHGEPGVLARDRPAAGSGTTPGQRPARLTRR